MPFSKIKIAQGLFFLNALIWLVFGLYTLLRMADRYPGGTFAVYNIIGFVMLGNVVAMLVSGVLLGRQNKRYYFFAIFVLLINILLTVTDQFGLFDLFTLLIDLALLGLLISIRRYHLSYEANP